ncbi:hypothetical protein CaCOL14_007244 [Colletotrichum acutatum]
MMDISPAFDRIATGTSARPTLPTTAPMSRDPGALWCLLLATLTAATLSTAGEPAAPNR